MLGVNMQTSFMHPPFGFALFYLRSVAAREPYKDRVTGQMMEPVTTGQIYWGAVPFVVIQCIMVGLVIAFPQMVMHYKSQAPTIDPSKIEIRIPSIRQCRRVRLAVRRAAVAHPADRTFRRRLPLGSAPCRRVSHLRPNRSRCAAPRCARRR